MLKEVLNIQVGIIRILKLREKAWVFENWKAGPSSKLGHKRNKEQKVR